MLVMANQGANLRLIKAISVNLIVNNANGYLV